MFAANLACDLDAWLRLLTLHDSGGLADADTLRFRLDHLPPAWPSATAAYLRTERTWPWSQAFATCRQRLTELPTLT